MKKHAICILVIGILLISACASGGAPKDAVTYKLKADEVTLKPGGNTKITKTGDGIPVIGWWDSADAELSWNVDLEYSCDYAVILFVSCDPQFPGSIVEVSIGGQTLEAEIPDTGAWGNYKKLQAGVVSLAKGSYTLKIKTKHLENRFVANLIDVRLVTR